MRKIDIRQNPNKVELSKTSFGKFRGLIACTLFVITILASCSQQDSNGFIFKKYDDHVELVGYKNNNYMPTLKIPSHYKGFPVTVIRGCKIYNIQTLGGYDGGSIFGQNNCSADTIIIPNTVTTIREYAFFDCRHLKSVTIPNSVITIGEYAFSVCMKLKNVTLPNSVKHIGNSAFNNCDELERITLPESMIDIGDLAFERCGNLTNITLPKTLKTMGDNLFSNCYNLIGNITIPNGVSHIGKQTFWYCSKLTSVTIPNSVTTIGYHAFDNCRELGIIKIAATTPPILEDIFQGIFADLKILVPKGSLNAYKTANGWNSFADKIVGY